MANQFIGQLMLVGFNFAPAGWAQCQGQLLPISSNTALFSLLGTNYGGNGTSNFALPNLQGRCAIGAGQGVGLSQYDIGQAGGSATITLSTSNVPSHTHTVKATDSRAANVSTPAGNFFSKVDLTAVGNIYDGSPAAPFATMSPSTLSPSTGGNLPHNNMMPYLALNWIIALQGVFPPRS
jgi:microcystin-dependent protein